MLLARPEDVRRALGGFVDVADAVDFLRDLEDFVNGGLSIFAGLALDAGQGAGGEEDRCMSSSASSSYSASSSSKTSSSPP